jgi:hypothetical protein
MSATKLTPPSIFHFDLLKRGNYPKICPQEFLYCVSDCNRKLFFRTAKSYFPKTESTAASRAAFPFKVCSMLPKIVTAPVKAEQASRHVKPSSFNRGFPLSNFFNAPENPDGTCRSRASKQECHRLD